jgi:1-acyl-sn-glycerol-3-phosphate acyltransferase
MVAVAPLRDSDHAARDAARLCALEDVCRRDMASLAGLAPDGPGGMALAWLFGAHARRFAREVAAFDAEVAGRGLPVAARALAARYGSEIVGEGVAHVPAVGPVLFVPNHPGLADGLALYATAPRIDVRAVARPQPLLGLMPNFAPHVLLLPDDGPARGGALRAVLRSLRAGGALALFPAGSLEPEPSLVADGEAPLGPWSSGLGTLVRLAARDGVPVRVVPTAISGALSAATWRRFGPLIRLRRTARGRADLAAFLQLAFPSLGRTTVRVRYGRPLAAAELAAASPDSAGVTGRVRAEVLRLLSLQRDDGTPLRR